MNEQESCSWELVDDYPVDPKPRDQQSYSLDKNQQIRFPWERFEGDQVVLRTRDQRSYAIKTTVLSSQTFRAISRDSDGALRVPESSCELEHVLLALDREISSRVEQQAREDMMTCAELIKRLEVFRRYECHESSNMVRRLICWLDNPYDTDFEDRSFDLDDRRTIQNLLWTARRLHVEDLVFYILNRWPGIEQPNVYSYDEDEDWYRYQKRQRCSCP